MGVLQHSFDPRRVHVLLNIIACSGLHHVWLVAVRPCHVWDTSVLKILEPLTYPINFNQPHYVKWVLGVLGSVQAESKNSL